MVAFGGACGCIVACGVAMWLYVVVSCSVAVWLCGCMLVAWLCGDVQCGGMQCGRVAVWWHVVWPCGCDDDMTVMAWWHGRVVSDGKKASCGLEAFYWLTLSVLSTLPMWPCLHRQKWSHTAEHIS